MRSKAILVAAGLTIAVVEMAKYQAYCKSVYDRMWCLRYAAHICEFLAPYYAIYTNASNSIPDNPLSDESLHLSGEGAAQFSWRFGSHLDPATLSAHSAAASSQGSSRP
jgi:hypothetical protein